MEMKLMTRSIGMIDVNVKTGMALYKYISEDQVVTYLEIINPSVIESIQNIQSENGCDAAILLTMSVIQKRDGELVFIVAKAEPQPQQ